MNFSSSPLGLDNKEEGNRGKGKEEEKKKNIERKGPVRINVPIKSEYSELFLSFHKYSRRAGVDDFVYRRINQTVF